MAVKCYRWPQVRPGFSLFLFVFYFFFQLFLPFFNLYSTFLFLFSALFLFIIITQAPNEGMNGHGAFFASNSNPLAPSLLCLCICFTRFWVYSNESWSVIIASWKSRFPLSISPMLPPCCLHLRADYPPELIAVNLDNDDTESKSAQRLGPHFPSTVYLHPGTPQFFYDHFFSRS